MKRVLWVLGILVVGAGLFGLGWISHGVVSQAPVASANPAAPTPQPAPSPALVSMSEWQQLRAAREAAFQANPDLAAEYKQIIHDMQTEQAKFDAAMIKTDPQVEPIVVKLVALRERNGGPSPVPATR